MAARVTASARVTQASHSRAAPIPTQRRVKMTKTPVCLATKRRAPWSSSNRTSRLAFTAHPTRLTLFSSLRHRAKRDTLHESRRTRTAETYLSLLPLPLSAMDSSFSAASSFVLYANRLPISPTNHLLSSAINYRSTVQTLPPYPEEIWNWPRKRLYL